MDKLIKTIRKMTGLSQEQFAKELGTTAVTINRWENGKTVPKSMAQKHLNEFCEQHDLFPHLFEQIVKSFTAESEDGNIILYHGSKSGIDGQIAPRSRRYCDFGTGFYLGTSPAQPLTLVCTANNPKIYSFKLDTNGLKVLNVEMGITWAMLIGYCRGYMRGYERTAVYQKYARMMIGYDMIVGYIADDKMFTVLQEFFRNRITDAALLNSLSALDIGKQYVCITQRACNSLQIISEESLSVFECSILQRISNQRRDEGIELAESMLSQFRREGKFFDELLKEGEDGEVT